MSFLFDSFVPKLLPMALNLSLRTSETNDNKLFQLRRRAYLAFGYSKQSIKSTLSSELTNHPDMITWYIKDGTQIVATASLIVLRDKHPFEARIETILNVINSNVELKYPSAYFTRLAIDPDYWGLGLSEMLYQVRLDFIYKNKIQSGIFNSTNDKMINKFEKKNWRFVGEILPELLKPDIKKSQIYVKYFGK